MSNNIKTRVIKKNNAYYSQYLKTWWFGKYKKWVPYTFTMSYLVCSGYAEDTKLEVYFDTKLEALHFIKRNNI